jgi:2,6-dihydroxypseudooxynicotine hydrolase
MSTEPQGRVQIAANHWRPRFVANGIDLNDFEKVVGSTNDWKDWAPNWRTMGDVHLDLAEDAARARRTVSATEAYQRAAWCYHLGKFLWFEDRALHAQLHQRTVATYTKALPHLDPPGERMEVPFESAVIPADRAAPAGRRWSFSFPASIR